MTTRITKVSRRAFAAYLGGDGGEPGWTTVSDGPESLLVSRPAQGSTPADVFTIYQATAEAGDRTVTDAALLQSAASGRYVTALPIQVDGVGCTAFAAAGDSPADAALFAVYTFGILSSFWWFDPARQRWAGLTNTPSTQFGGSGLLVASGPVQAVPSLLPWKGQLADPAWTFTPPGGWDVPVGSDLSFVDFTLTDASALPFDFTDCVLRGTVLAGKAFGSARFVRCDLGRTVMAPPLGAAPDTWIDFSGATVPYPVLGNDWRYLTLDGAQITGFPTGGVTPPVTAQGTRLHDVAMAAWNLTGADLSQAQLVGAGLTGAVLKGVSFRGAVLAPTDAPPGAGGADRPAVLSGADLRNADLSGAQLRGVRFVNAALYGERASVTGADVREADFTGARLDGLDFRGVAGRDLSGAVFSQATLTGADFSQTKLLGVYLTGADLEGAALAGAQLGEVSGAAAADLSAAFMPNAVLTDANLYRVSMPYAQLYGGNARLDNADLEGADLADANLAGMDLTQVKLAGAVLDGANLIGCSLAGAQLKQVSLVKASLQGVDLTGAGLAGAHLANAAVALADGVVLFTLDAATYTGTLNKATVSVALRSAFQNAAYPLNDSAAVTVETRGRCWLIEEDAPLPHQGGLGYIGFRLVADDDVITVHGTILAVARLGDHDELEVVTVSVEPTQLAAHAMSDDTVCPNQRTYFENRNLGLPWSAMMTAPRLPKPPDCVPGPDHWCTSGVRGRGARTSG